MRRALRRLVLVVVGVGLLAGAYPSRDGVRYSIFDQASSNLRGETDMVVKDMKPRHVYQAE